MTEAIEELRNGGKAGEIKRRARELGELATKAVEEGGSSHLNITKFIQDVIMHVLTKEEQAKKLFCKVVPDASQNALGRECMGGRD